MKPMILPFKPAHLLDEDPIEYCTAYPCSLGLEYLASMDLPEEVDLLDILREKYASNTYKMCLIDYCQWLFEHYVPLRNNQWLLDFCKEYAISRNNIWCSTHTEDFIESLEDYFKKEQANEAT